MSGHSGAVRVDVDPGEPGDGFEVDRFETAVSGPSETELSPTRIGGDRLAGSSGRTRSASSVPGRRGSAGPRARSPVV
jgi:hypothetical protein